MSSIRCRCTYEATLATVLFLVIALACALMPMQSDTWWHLRAGHDMWSSHKVLLTDVYSHTSTGSFWPNHEWLSEVIYFAVYYVGGLPLVTLFATVLIVTAWLITWRLVNWPVRYKFIAIAFAIIPASFGWEPRPHAFSLLFLMVTTYCCLTARDLWLPLLFVVWANCHGGVLIGLMVVGTYVAASVISSRRLTWRPIFVFLGCLAGTCVTPLGLSFWTAIPKSLVRIQHYPIDEWRAPTLWDARLVPFWVVSLILCASLLRNRLKPQQKQRDMLCLSAVFLLAGAVLAIRNVGPFLMVALPALSTLIPLEESSHFGRPSKERPLANLGIVIVGAACVIGAIIFAYRVGMKHLRWQPIPKPALSAIQACPDNLYNRYDEGGYLLWFTPTRRVFLDGRQDPFDERLVLEHIRVETTGDYDAVFARYRIRCAFLPTVSPVAARLSAAGWVTLYRDSDWVVFTQ